MFFEMLGKLFFSKIRPSLFFGLLLFPILFVGAILYLQFTQVEEASAIYTASLPKAKPALEKKKRQEAHMARYKPADPFYLDHSLESLVFLKEEIASLKKLLAHPALSNKKGLGERLRFLTGEENRLVFIEDNIKTGGSMKETEEKQKFPVQMNESDIKKVLSLIEDVSIETFTPDANSPQFLIRDFQMERKGDLFQVEMELVKREFTKGS